MTKLKLYEILKNNNINESMYSLEGGFPHGGYALSRKDDGWEVYYSVFGIAYKSRFYKDESDACFDLYNRIMGFISSFDDETKSKKSWRFIGAISYNGKIFGVKIFDYDWHITGKNVVLEDPHYNQKHTLDIYEVEINGEIKRFATGEFSNSVYGFYVERDNLDDLTEKW